MMKVSIIVPVYKVEKYLNRCITSILDSSYKDLELILVDDGSPDKCPQMCDEWEKKDSRIKVIHQNNTGLSGARNTGIRVSTGGYISFVDSDDWISHDMIEVLVNLLEKNNADIAMCNMVRVANILKNIKNSKERIEVYSQQTFLDVMFRNKGNRCVHYACGKVYKKNVLDQVEHFPVGLLNEDVEATFKAVLKSNKIVETNRIGYFYYYNPCSITGSTFGNNYLSLITVWDRMKSIGETVAPQYLDSIIYNQKRTSFTILCDMILYGNETSDKIYRSERKFLLNSLRKDLLFLLKSPMQLPRKMFMILVCYQYSAVKRVIRLIIKGAKLNE